MRFERWFRRAAALVLLTVCGFAVWFTYSSAKLEAERDELLLSLDTLRGRERKQVNEYRTASESIAVKQEALLDLIPRVEAAAEVEAQIRAQHKSLKAEVKALKAERSKLQEQLDEITRLRQSIEEAERDIELTRQKMTELTAEHEGG